MPPTLRPSPSSISMTFRRQYVLPAPGLPVIQILCASPMPPTSRHKYALLYKNTLRIRRLESAPPDRPTASGGTASPQLAPSTKDIKRHASGASVHRLKLVLLIVGIVIATVGLLGALYGILAASTAQTEYDFFCPGDRCRRSSVRASFRASRATTRSQSGWPSSASSDSSSRSRPS